MLLNYTTQKDADATINEISKCLSKHGASSVMTDYDPQERVIKSLSFKIALNGRDIVFRLPCDWKPVYEVLFVQKKMKQPRQRGTIAQIEDSKAMYEKRLSDLRLQSVRTSWRIIKDWVEAQMALVETHMVTVPQVFLPYVVMKDNQTLSDKFMSDAGFLLNSADKN